MRMLSMAAMLVACSNSAPVPVQTVSLDATRVHLTRITCDLDDQSRRDLLAGRGLGGDSRTRKLVFAPQAAVDVPPFVIDQKPVNCEQWRACVDAGACAASHRACFDGVVRTSHGQAVKYCHWRGGRLPTYVEWQRAVRGEEGLTEVSTLKEGLTRTCGPHSRPVQRFGDNCEVVSRDNVFAYVKFGEEWMETLKCRGDSHADPYELKIRTDPKQGLDAYDIEINSETEVAWEHGAQFRCVMQTK